MYCFYNKSKDKKNLGNYRVQKMASYLHHTATTIYLCCVPALEDSTGASCVGLASANIQSFNILTIIFFTEYK